ncbi:MAG: bifunctional UDP-N-acetylglucosamine diphosphorylase/glucosamine-1-phosphate N-acetyltransferase GlmU, partial [Gammaproteobacteria bacterium]|nr:bifunctional UDP-N-acetylglucosamine diphosphorylase/glucosamine-1-phosphate N-acetyltransferase GlmU [Gammaproteobacteria bacterium]
ADSIHVVYGHGGDAVRAAFPDPSLSWHAQHEQLGTGHAVAQALPEIPADHRVLVLCGDVPLIRPQALESLLSSAEDTCLALLTADLDDPAGYGRIQRGIDGSVVGIVEQADASDDVLRITEINTGILTAPAGKLSEWIGKLDRRNAQGEYYLTDVVEQAVADGTPVTGVVIDDARDALGINDRVQLAAAERALQRRLANELLQAGVSLADPERIDIRGELSAGRDVFIDINAILIGRVTLGEGVRVGPNVLIRDSTIGDGTAIHANSVIDGAEIGASCEIGPFARLRPETKLAARVKIGNFVETKKSDIGTGSKVNHLSYVGDTTIGIDVNVGAGTITCNYDGANKHRTTIGNDVFIGSSVNLVAPVTIGDGASIGARAPGAKDAPAGQLTVARTRQTSIPHWKRPQKKPAK